MSMSTVLETVSAEMAADLLDSHAAKAAARNVRMMVGKYECALEQRNELLALAQMVAAGNTEQAALESIAAALVAKCEAQ